MRIHIPRRGIGEEPRGQRAYSLAAWLADMRTSIGEILPVNRIIELMQAPDTARSKTTSSTGGNAHEGVNWC